MMTNPTADSRSANAIFALLLEEFRQEVVLRALRYRVGGKGAAKPLRAELRRLRVDGYRDASWAPNQKLLHPVLDAIRLDDAALAGAVLDVWMESQEALREATAAHLAAQGIPTPAPSDAYFESSWSHGAWQRERTAMIGADESRNADEVGLMLCLVSRRFPQPPRVKSQRFGTWISKLQKLDPDASEWGEIDAFTKWVLHIREWKRDQYTTWCQEGIRRGCDDLRKRFGEELRYLAIDPDPWPGDIGKRPAMAGPTLTFVGALAEQLKAYQSVHPQAASRDEERRRATERQKREDGIFRLVNDWEQRRAQPDPVEEADPVEQQPGDQPAGAIAEKREQELDGLRKTNGRLLDEVATLREQNSRLHDGEQAFALEKAQYGQTIDQLRRELSQSRKMEEQWRQSYVDAMRRSRTETDDEPEIGNVQEALDLAQEKFPDRLLIKLNSRSTPETPFENPDEVFKALAWLATAFGDVAPERIREAIPGWSYKPNQSDNTKGQYRDWYRTQVEGVNWDLANHVGKGTSRDPRHIIRIAFAWDKENGRVIVGFVGPHQKNRQT